MGDKLSVQERFNRYYEAKLVLFMGQAAAVPGLTVDPGEIPITPRTGAEVLADRQAAFRDGWMARCVVECDIGLE
jgi:hypothetical protein